MEKDTTYCNSLSTLGPHRHFHLPCKTSVENVSQVKKKKQTKTNIKPQHGALMCI